MFAPSASTRRSLCLGAFILVCVLPTLYVSYMAATIRSPAHTAEVADRLRAWLDLDVELSGIAYPRPGIVEYRDLRLLDPETRRRVAEIDHLRLTGDETHLQLTARAATLFTGARRVEDASADIVQTSMAGPAVEATPAAAADSGIIWSTFDRLLGRLGRSGITSVTFQCADLGVESAGNVHRLNDVVARYKTDREGSDAMVRFRLAGLQMAVPSELQVRRDRLDGTAATRVVVRTGPTPLPMKLLGPYFDTEGWLGPRARFQGTIWLDGTGGGWIGGAEGRLAGADLDSAVTRRFPHRLGGTADLQIDRLRWADGRIQHVLGSLRAGPGLVSAELLHDLARYVGFQLGDGVPRRGQVPYTRLAFSFAMAAGGLDIAGRCQSATADAVMVGDTVLLRHPLGTTEIAGLVRALVPAVGVFVPANLETHSLLRVLPLPGRRRSLKQSTAPHVPRQNPPERLPPQSAGQVPSEESDIEELPALHVSQPR